MECFWDCAQNCVNIFWSLSSSLSHTHVLCMWRVTSAENYEDWQDWETCTCGEMFCVRKLISTRNTASESRRQASCCRRILRRGSKSDWNTCSHGLLLKLCAAIFPTFGKYLCKQHLLIYLLSSFHVSHQPYTLCSLVVVVVFLCCVRFWKLASANHFFNHF